MKSRFLSSGSFDPITIITGAISAFSAIQGFMSAGDAKDASKEQAANEKKAQEAKQRQSDTEAQRARVAAVREARIKRGQLIASGTNTGLGVSGTSGVSGGVSSIGSQENANIGYINQQQGFANTISDFNQKAADAQGKVYEANASAQTWQSIGNISGSIFKAKGGFTTIFGGNKPTNGTNSA